MYDRSSSNPQRTPREQGLAEQQIQNLKDFIMNFLATHILPEVENVTLMLQSDMKAMERRINKTIQHETDMLLSDLYRDHDHIMSILDPEFAQDDPPQPYEDQREEWEREYDRQLEEDLRRLNSSQYDSEYEEYYGDDRSSGYDSEFEQPTDSTYRCSLYTNTSKKTPKELQCRWCSNNKKTQ